MMKIWVDADACPRPVRETLCRAANRKQIDTTFVANQAITLPPSKYLHALQVPKGFDVADNEIVKRATAGDLVITQDIPLAAALVEAGVHAINPHGDAFTRDNIAERLRFRDLTENLRNAGLVEGGGRKPFSAADRAAFANALDRFLAKHS